jgi:hypothetical protein
MTDDHFMLKAQFEQYAKAVNGSLVRIEAKVEILEAKLDQTFFQMQEKVDKSCDKHDEDIERLRERIDTHVPKWVAYLLSFLSATSVGLLSALVVVLVKG